MSEAKTDIKQSDEWQKAVAYEITDHDIERQRQLIGFDEAARTAEYVQTASVDSIRNWAYGCGDDNPLFTDPNYAKKTRWGGVIAPGMMVGQINKPLKGDPVPDEIKQLRKSLFRGIHVFVSGSDWNSTARSIPATPSTASTARKAARSSSRNSRAARSSPCAAT